MTKADSVSFDLTLNVRIVEMVQEAVQYVITELNDPEKQGGYFCLVDMRGNSTALPKLVLGVGTVPIEKGQKYIAFAQEKARRLAEHLDHVSSWQSRNPEKNQWGGAIDAGPYCLSFSGLPELADEASMLLAALYIGLLTTEQAMRIASHSANQLFNKVRIHFTPPPR